MSSLGKIPNVSIEEVQEAINSLTERGIRITDRAVLGQIGHGSMSTIHGFMVELERRRLAIPPDMSRELSPFFEAAMKVVNRKAAERTAAFSDKVANLEKVVSDVMAEADINKARALDLEVVLRSKEDLIKMLEAKAKVLIDQSDVIRKEKEEVVGQLNRIQGRLESIQGNEEILKEIRDDMRAMRVSNSLATQVHKEISSPASVSSPAKDDTPSPARSAKPIPPVKAKPATQDKFQEVPHTPMSELDKAKKASSKETLNDPKPKPRPGPRM
jgi:myosin heavy subunit